MGECRSERRGGEERGEEVRAGAREEKIRTCGLGGGAQEVRRVRSGENRRTEKRASRARANVTLAQLSIETQKQK